MSPQDGLLNLVPSISVPTLPDQPKSSNPMTSINPISTLPMSPFVEPNPIIRKQTDKVKNRLLQMSHSAPSLLNSGSLNNQTAFFPVPIPAGAPFASPMGGKGEIPIASIGGGTKQHESMTTLPDEMFSSILSAPASLTDLRTGMMNGTGAEARHFSTRTTPTGSKRKKKQLSKTELFIRRQKHKKVENRRRKRIANLFGRLSDALKCHGADKASILEKALERIQNTEKAFKQKNIGKVEESSSFSMMESESKALKSIDAKSVEMAMLEMKKFSSVPLTLIDAKNMILLSNSSFMKKFHVNSGNSPYVNLGKFVSGVDFLKLKQHFSTCQKEQLDEFQQIVSVNLNGTLCMARIYATLLLTRTHFIARWVLLGSMT
eukprot:CAMPEP_0167749434 /NCGR_PEP_ID=MMETSP0110_2-20121227/5403_1 /TAXON_ID=629695 /ORGANISM="Gymnochlora sp., Strain CCMP2014" /LENGTH=375 /DNA_ID=CAMNT_0007634583 /DNA_START=218 /DNA_END=1345 /DNA_ORIENTATION=-